MVLGFKQVFKDGTPTHFKEKILKGEKIHSLREDENNRWKAGKSLQMANGVRTKNYHQFNKGMEHLEKCKGTQRVFMTYNGWALEITVGNIYLTPEQIELLIKNDGVSREQFLDWFFPKEKDEWSGKIIHWTDFKY